jgi:hypothetical protein
MAFDPDQRRKALAAFMAAHNLRAYPWATEAGLNEASLRGFFAGRTRTLSDETYERLAEAAGRMLQRPVTAAELRDEPNIGRPIQISHTINASDVVHTIVDGGPHSYVDAPPGWEKGSAGVVRGSSGAPAFDDGDTVFWGALTPPPTDPPRKPVIAKVKDGALMLKKILPGTMPGRFHLVSINPATAALLDVELEGIARIGWIKPAD